MLDTDQRTAVIQLHQKGHGIRTIARTLGISRKSVKRVLKQGSAEVPKIERGSKADEQLDRIRELYLSCRGNLVRVWEELEAEGFPMAYSTLTHFCRRHEIGVEPKQPAGSYHFKPGKESQHDTSPHDVVVGGKSRRLQCAAMVFPFSRMRYAQAYPTFNRFYCKCFLTDGIVYIGGAPRHFMIDNTSVIIAYGTGDDAVPAPEMAAFADRFDTKFKAHKKGDANRSAHVERFFDHIENNFYPGRTFEDLGDLNRQMAIWCDTLNHSFKKRLGAKPVELFQAEKPLLKPLPIHIPEVYALHSRIVDIQGYVNLHTNAYSAPADLIGRTVEVRESLDRVRIFHGHKVVAEHSRLEEGCRKRATLPAHERRGLWRQARGNGPEPLPEEKLLREASPAFASLLTNLHKSHRRSYVSRIRKLYRMFLDYPTPALVQNVEQALKYGLTDVSRIETMVLRALATDFFCLPDPEDPEGEDHG